MKIVRGRRQPDSEKAVDNLYHTSLYFASGALAREVGKLAIKCFKPSRLSPSLATVLMYLSWCQTTGPSYLAKSMLLSPSTMTRLLDKLEKLDLVCRFEYDGIRMVNISPAGMALVPLLCRCANEFRQRCEELLGEDNPLAGNMNEATDILRSATSRRRQEADGNSPKD